MTYDNRQFYIDGAWVDPAEPKAFTVVNPATEAPAGVISMGSAKDVERAVTAARHAFDGYSRTTPAERHNLFSSRGRRAPVCGSSVVAGLRCGSRARARWRTDLLGVPARGKRRVRLLSSKVAVSP